MALFAHQAQKYCDQKHVQMLQDGMSESEHLECVHAHMCASYQRLYEFDYQ